ncbi:DUF1775 domain-containing protein [Micromonospora krabiensis]|uniref:Uncharacterized protein YcnI n=1 Tax=Micromonospora krabiensis TaxID=307121 RepID=A0A1C3N279_9ACTN|nr:DUF1775 domain-containing protein [Micromonospora krabiensis]SBV26690.1 Uncharacterized protein YcnI [Micromonospora krabiensis]
MAMTYGGRRRLRAGGVAALATATVLGWPGAAQAAEVSTVPGQARQGESVRLEFVVPEERAGTQTRQIEVRLPADQPIAEVYPMSVPGWAPRISSRTLDKPVAGIHSSTVTTVTESVTWIRVDGAPAGPARLALSMGPLPRADRLAFPVVQTYADGTVVRWAEAAGAHKAPVLTLLPAAPGAPDAPAGHGGHGAVPGGAADAGAAVDSGAGSDSGPVADGGAPAATGGVNADALLAAGLLAGLGGGAAIGWLASRWRRRSTTGHADDRANADAPTGTTDPDSPEADAPTGATGPANATAAATTTTTGTTGPESPEADAAAGTTRAESAGDAAAEDRNEAAPAGLRA